MSKSFVPPIGGNSASNSTKDKRYFQQVEKVLLSFDSIEEWADYIAFLSKLQKALQLNESKPSSTPLPYSPQIAYKLSLCLSSKLPNGVHQKTLSLYESIFTSLSPALLDSQINIWLPGLLPVLSYCSIQIKPLLATLFQQHIINKLSQPILKVVTKPLILAFLPGLDDEQSETFGEYLSLMDSLKRKMADDNHFWQSFFLCIINNPERRLGGLYWCNKRLPVFNIIKKSSNDNKVENLSEAYAKGDIYFSDEAQACISPEPGLLIRAFASSITSTTSIIAANDIIVVRGFFDLLLSHLPLNSTILTTIASKKDRELLVDSCCSITLKKDMSLNRRLWNWLLGPESETSSSTSLPASTSGKSQSSSTAAPTTPGSDTASSTSNKLSRSEYFVQYSLPLVSEILLKKIVGKPTSSVDQYLAAFKISLSLILDKWEISRVITPVLFLPIMRTTFQNYKQNEILLTTAQSFFDSVEAMYIWNDLTKLIVDDQELELVEFIINNFDINEEEMKEVHIPLGVVCVLNILKTDERWLSVLETLLQGIRLEKTPEGAENQLEPSVSSIIEYYESLIKNPSTAPPFTRIQTSSYLLSSLKSLVITNIDNHEKSTSTKFTDLYCQLTTKESDPEIIEKMLGVPVTENSGNSSNILTAFNLVKLLKLVDSSLTSSEKDKLLRIIMTNLYSSLTSSLPTNFQVESVKSIFQLESFYSKYQIEASILKLFISTQSSIERIRALSTLWIHSSNQYNEVDSILLRPLFLVLDELAANGGERDGSERVANFISSNILKGGSSNRLLKLITSPLLAFDHIIDGDKDRLLRADDDLRQFSYYLSTIVNVIRTDEKHVKESFNNELVVMDSTSKLNAINSNSWNISTYKTLVFNIVEKFLSLKLSDELLQDERLMFGYSQSIEECLKLYTLLVTGNESDFIKKFHVLIDRCSYIIDCSGSSGSSVYIERSIEKYISSILSLLKLSENQRVNLNLLQIDDEGKDPQLVRFIVKGIKNAQTVVLLESWTNLLTKSLYLFNESVFSVLLTLNDVLVLKIREFFNEIKLSTSNANSFSSKINSLNDIESSINILFAGLEDLLSISHSYLLTSNFRARENNGNSIDGSSGSASASGNGFFGNVIQGVFSIESPSIRTAEENKKYSILLAFSDAVEVGYSIWLWAETKTSEFSSTGIYLSRKLKFKARKLLESLIELERQEVIECLISLLRVEPTSKNRITKLLHVLDGGRSQITLPNVFNSILSRLYPAALDEKSKSSLNTDLSSKELSRFLSDYIESVDDDTISDIWTFTLQFFKDVNAHPTSFNPILPDLLKTITILMCKLSNYKLIDQGRNKRDLGDIFVKLLTISVRGEVSEREKEREKEKEKGREEDSNDKQSEKPSRAGTPIPKERAIATQSELLDTLTLILSKLNEILSSEPDKITSCINTIITSLVSPQIKTKRVHEIPLQTITLISLIGENFSQNKAWKTTVSDCFSDNSFFKAPKSILKEWEPIVRVWILIEKDRIFDLITKVAPITTSATPNIFNWNESSEIESKVFNLKRIIYLILVQPKDYFLNNLEDLINRLNLTNSGYETISPPMYKGEVLVLLRAIALKFNEMHLLSHWTMISYEIISNFNELIEAKNSKELSHLTPKELKVVLFNCKLLDQLLLLKYDEFNLNEWLYVNSSPEVVTTATGVDVGQNGKSNGKKNIFSIIDKISDDKDFSSSKESAIKINSLIDDDENGEFAKPLLEGIKKIESISSLRLFFSSLSLLHYERTFGLKKVDAGICEEDILNDIVSSE